MMVDVTCRTGSLENRNDGLDFQIQRYLPHRQLRNSRADFSACRYCYLPHRQLRKRDSTVPRRVGMLPAAQAA